MSMEKRGVTGESNINVVGASTDDGAVICKNCKKIVIKTQIKEEGVCPFCESKI